MRLRNEIQALHLVIPLLAEDRDWIEHGLAPPLSSPSLGTGTSGFPRDSSP
jgi:hypothetical protein